MNALGIALLWTALQVSLFCLAGTAAYLASRRIHRAWAASLLCGVLLIAAGIAAFSFSPWPRWWTLPDVRPARQMPHAACRQHDDERAGTVDTFVKSEQGGRSSGSSGTERELVELHVELVGRPP